MKSSAYQRAEMPKGTAAVLETRTLESSNANLLHVLKPGQFVLDVGCGSGAITRGIPKYVGPTGKVVGMDRSEDLIRLAKENNTSNNCFFEAADIMDYHPGFQFDIITTARTLQWIAAPETVIKQMLPLLKPGGMICVLDYNHEAISWHPAPPQSMQDFYAAFLKWRADAGMDNAIGDHVADLLKAAGGTDITVEEQHEDMNREQEGFETHASIWKKVAETRGNQLVSDGYISESGRLQAIAEYEQWMKTTAQNMRLYLKATHARFL